MYEYVALTWRTHDSGRDPVFGDDMRELLDERWEELCRASFEPSCVGGACIMRRVKSVCDSMVDTVKATVEPCCEGRLWTKTELQKLIRDERAFDVLMGDAVDERELVKSILEDAQTEADMQTGYRKELQKRNAGLQAAIDVVVSIGGWEAAAVPTLRAVRRYLYPLATKKEESNG